MRKSWALVHLGVTSWHQLGPTAFPLPAGLRFAGHTRHGRSRVRAFGLDHLAPMWASTWYSTLSPCYLHQGEMVMQHKTKVCKWSCSAWQAKGSPKARSPAVEVVHRTSQSPSATLATSMSRREVMGQLFDSDAPVAKKEKRSENRYTEKENKPSKNWRTYTIYMYIYRYIYSYPRSPKTIF